MKNFSDKKRILFFGDSITFCHDPNAHDRMAIAKRWTTLVQNNFTNDFDFIVEGLGGRTLSQDDELEGRNGLKAFIQAMYSHVYLDYVFIMLGTNNLKDRFRNSAEEIAKEFLKYNEVVNEFNKNWEVLDTEKSKIVLIAPPRINEKFLTTGSAFSGAQKISDELATEYSKIAKELAWDFIDASGVVVSELDGIHLDEEGNKKLAELVIEYFKKQI